MQFGKQLDEHVKVVGEPAVTLPVQEICTLVPKPGKPEGQSSQDGCNTYQ